MTDIIDLKLCPFCDSDVLKVSVCKLGGTRPDYIQCITCGAKVEYDHYNCDDPSTGQILKKLIERWNRRASE